MAHSETGVEIYQNTVFMLEAASWCPGRGVGWAVGIAAQIQNQTPGECCEGKDRGALAGGSRGNRQFCFVVSFTFFPFFFLMETDLSTKKKKKC